jgi:hypothetical protein
MQVSHHPPIFAFHTESNSATYQCYGEIEIKNKFWGRSIEVSLLPFKAFCSLDFSVKLTDKQNNFLCALQKWFWIWILILHFQVINLGVFCLGNNFPLNLQVLCNGVVHLKIPKFGDHITWNRATLCIHNVVVGKLWIDNYGEVLVRNHSTGEMARVRFHKATSQQQCHISGKVTDTLSTHHFL